MFRDRRKGRRRLLEDIPGTLDLFPVLIGDKLNLAKYNPDWAPTFGPGSYAKHDTRDVGTESYNAWTRLLKSFFASPAMSQVSRQLLDYYDKKQSEDFTKKDHWLKHLSERESKGGRSPQGDETLLLPDRVFGFVLRTRTWSMRLRVLITNNHEADYA